MKISRKTQLGLQISENHDWQLKVIANQTNNIQAMRGHVTEDEIEYGINNATELVLEDGEFMNQNYLIKSSAINMVKKIPVDTPKFDIKFLKNLPYKKATFLLGEKLAMKYYRTSTNVHAIFYTLTDSMGGLALVWSFLRIDLTTGEIIIPKQENSEAILGGNKKGFQKMETPYEIENFKLFIQLLLFVELSELTIEILKPKQKCGNKKSGKYLNDSNSNILVVDSKWNVVSVRNEGFLVSGHWRMQPCGVNRQERKMIWIDTFEKEGYVRRHRHNNINVNH